MKEQLCHFKSDESGPRASGEGIGVQLPGERTRGSFSMIERVLPPQSKNVLPSKGQVTLYVVAGSITVSSPEQYAGLLAHQGDILHFPTGELPLYANAAQVPAKVLEQVFFTPATSERFVYVKAAEGRFLAVISDVGAVKLTGEHSRGAYLLMEWSVPAHGGVALHAQSGQETFYVIGGQFLFRGLDDGRQQYALHAGPGDIVHVPQRVPHAYQNEGEAPGRMLVLTTPAGKAEQFFEEIGTPVPDAQAFPTSANVPDPAALLDLLQRYQVEIFP